MKKERRNHLTKALSLLLAAVLTLSCLPVRALENREAFAPEVFGKVEEYSTHTPGEILKDSYYYTDYWFDQDPGERNDALALLSMQLVAATVDDDPDGNGAGMLKELGFSDVGFVNFNTPDSDDLAYMYGIKVKDDTAIIAIVVQSYSFSSAVKEKAWKQNFTVNGTSINAEHYAFAKAVDKVIDSIVSLVPTMKAKYWVMGQSRGGALANMIAARLPQKINSSGIVNKGVFAYTFESPAVVDSSANDETAYGYIHNYICSDDPVPKVPMWGMVRYGVDYKLNTTEANAQIVEQLTRLQSPQAEDDVPDFEDYVRALVASVETQAAKGKESGGPSRDDYSRVRAEIFTVDDEQISISYNYQDIMVKLMGVIFEGDFSGLSMDNLSDQYDVIVELITSLVDAVITEESGDYAGAAPSYWKAATGIHAVLNSMLTAPVSLDDTDFYGLLRLAGPLLVDTSFEPESDEFYDMIIYLLPALELVEKIGGITYSHHFDGVIARLKALAPQPELDPLNIEIDAPAAGDPAQKMADQVKTFIENLGYDWLIVENAEVSASGELESGSIYYLTVTLNAVGHQIPEDYQLTVNDEEPYEIAQVGYRQGTGTITAVWEYAIGDVDNVIVSFETGTDIEPPQSIQVPRGKSLKYVNQPGFFARYTDENGKNWRFGEWKDEQGSSWDDIIVNDNMTLHAFWIQVIDMVDLVYAIPAVGEAVGTPVPRADELYYVYEYHVYDGEYNDLETIEAPGEYELTVFIRVDPEKAEFSTELDEDDWPVFDGAAYVNDVQCDCYYEEYDGYVYLTIYYLFTVTDGQASEVTYSFTEGAGQLWIRGSEEGAHFVVKAEENDDSIIELFSGIEIDGNTVDPQNYDYRAGSVIIDLKAEYLETLEDGSHDVKAVFENGSAQTTLTIGADGGVPDTGDHRALALYMVMTALSAAGMAIICLKKKD